MSHDLGGDGGGYVGFEDFAVAAAVGSMASPLLCGILSEGAELKMLRSLGKLIE